MLFLHTKLCVYSPGRTFFYGSRQRNTEEDKAELRQLAEKYDLIVTGGTDYHGSNTKRPHPLGTCTTEDAQLERIRRLARERKGL